MRRSWRSASCRAGDAGNSRNAAQFRVLCPLLIHAFELRLNPLCVNHRQLYYGRCSRAWRCAQTMRLQVKMLLSVASGSLGPATVRAFVPNAAPVMSSSAVRLSSMSTLLQTRATAARLQQQSAFPSSYAMRRPALLSWGWASSPSSSSSSLGRRSLSCMGEAPAGGGGGGMTFFSSVLFART